MQSFADDPHVDRIAEALWMREPVGSAALLVGAGFSRNATPVRHSVGTMPGWNDIYAVMVDQLYPATSDDEASDRPPTHRRWLLDQTGATSAYLRVAEEYEAQFSRDALDKLILRHVPDRQFSPGKLHRMLVELPWADMLTTNWDTLLERAGEAAEDRVYDVLRAVEEIPEARTPRIIKLHGSFPSNRPFVFTEEDFRRYPERAAAFVNLAQQVAMENMLVLVGFSGDDPNFLFWSGWVRDRLGPKAPPIYLVGALGLSSAKRKMLEGRRIQPVDLAALPEFAAWPSDLRVANAHQWFLERLRAAEPYRAQRWPKPAPGFLPALEYVTPRMDPCAPLPEPSYDGHAAGLATTRQFVGQWRRNRTIYPGWVVAPFDTAEYVWSGIRARFPEILPGLRGMAEDERLNALFELNWQLEIALIPLVLSIDDIIIELLDAMVERYDTLTEERAAQFRALVLAIVRHAREESDDALFGRWSAWLGERLRGDEEAQNRHAYELILLARANLEVDDLEERLDSWTPQGDTFWLLRKAGLLSEIGRDTEAAELSAQVLSTVRAQTLRGKPDIASWSRESIAMLFRTYALPDGITGWPQHQSARDRFDLRQDQLLARGCPGKRDFFDLIERLAQVPPPIRQFRETTRKFDFGSQNITHHLNGVDPRLDRLLAYRALRYQEETGIPIRINNTGLSQQILVEAARWLIDVAPTRAIDAFLRASPSASSKQFEALLSRTTVARMDTADADQLMERLSGLVQAALKRIAPNAPADDHWRDRLKSTLEIASRVILRTPARAPAWLNVAVSLQSDPRFRPRYAIGMELENLVKRCFEVARAADMDSMLLTVFSSTIQPGFGPYASNSNDLAAYTSSDLRVSARSPEWVAVIDETIAALLDRDRRKAASARLNWMLDSKLLDPDDEVRFGEALWHADFRVDGLPDETIFLRSAYLSLPEPDDVDASSLIVASILNDDPLTDAIVFEGEMTSAFRTSAFPMSGDQVVAEVARLHEFVARHADEPAHPDFVGHNRVDLVSQTSRMAAALARRATALSEPVAKLAELLALENFPLRADAALPASVQLGLLEASTARIYLRDLLLRETPADGVVLQSVLDLVLEMGRLDNTAFEEAIWTECAQSIAARHPVTLFPLLRFFASSFCRDPERVPTLVDDAISIGLAIILDETAMTSPAVHLQYDPYLVRHFGAVLAVAMKWRGRGDPAVIAAWVGAIDSDPLPDTRRARQIIGRSMAWADSRAGDVS